MFFVEKDETGAIVAVHQGQRKEGLEPVSQFDGEVFAFLLACRGTGGRSADMTVSDLSLIRVLEDLIDLLIDKNLILLTELPVEAQEKIRLRKSIRNAGEQPQIMVDDIL